MQDYNTIIGAIQMRLNKCPTELLRILKLAAIIKALLLAVSNKISTSPGESTYFFSSLFPHSTLLTTSISLELEALFCSAII